VISRRSVVGGLAGAVSAKSQRPSRPNFLFLIADDHAAYVFGADGNRGAEMPNFDRLASESVCFSQHYCNSPMCTPSRQSLLTGQLPHASGVTRLMTPLKDGKPTIARQLKQAGYLTAVYGKMHFQKSAFAGQHGFDLPVTEDEIARLWKQEIHPAPVPRDIPTTPPWRPLKDPSRIWLNADKPPCPRYAPDMEGAFIANQATQFLDEHRSRDQPFALWVSFMEPHLPFRFPVEGRSRFQPADFEVPAVGPEDAAQIPLVFRDLTEEDKRGIIAAYYTSVRFLDSQIGTVLQHLKKLGLDENTVVVYTADHGYMLGQHGRFEKHCGYDPALRVPLLVRYPGRYSPRTIRDLTEHVDLTSTILDILNAPPLTVQHGRSLRPYLERGKHTKPRNHIFSEYLENEEAHIRTHDHKFIYCTGRRARTEGYITDNPTPGRYVRLYDLRKDSGEFHNVAAREPKLVAAFKSVLLERFRNTHPNAAAEPRDVSSDEILDWYLRPPDA
jgi:choline-sulfatase